MKTLLSRFCEEFDGALRPLLRPLEELAEAVATTRPGPAADALPALHEANHQLAVLAKKVAEQQAYVLIFGPLKSGKSTLMNSISAAYVSEVTALPAYPCLVYVSHSERREFVVTRYDGDVQTFSGPSSMRMQVNRDHAELADRIRRAEDEGTDFDPALHFPEAIRRIDVRVPAPELAQSGAVLVDTPGLYSRMKFGYDRMTRDFRSSAACAIFVVKTDNLFLEQVFSEFNELLDLFSRVFLVVNLDSTKMDLRPDGSLAPSLEREDPVRVIEAFQTLTMDARLRLALDEGRLSIFPVDLLRAASRRLQGGRAFDIDASPESRDDFDVFLHALTTYLGSADYLVAFLGDSLHRAKSLLSDARAALSHRALTELERRAAALEEERARLEDRRGSLDRLVARDWRAAFDELRRDLAAEAARRGAEGIRRARTEANGVVQGWFADERSVQAMLEDDVQPIFERWQRELATGLEGELRRRAGGGHAASDVGGGVADDLAAIGLSIGDMAPSGLVAVVPGALVSRSPVDVDVSRIPVKRALVDWFLLRGRAAVRRGLIGPDRRPDQPIAVADKKKRLGPAAEAVLVEEIGGHFERAWQSAAERIATGLARDYAHAVAAAMEERLGALRGQNAARLADVERESARVRGLADRLGALRGRIDAAQSEIAALAARYARTAPEALTRPVDDDGDGAAGAELVPQPRREGDGRHGEGAEAAERIHRA